MEAIDDMAIDGRFHWIQYRVAVISWTAGRAEGRVDRRAGRT